MALKLTNDIFIERANSIHFNKYTYIDDYQGTNIKMNILCSNHGAFLQTPHNHLKGKGCPSCANIKKRYYEKEFIEKANIIHNYIYIYVDINYKTTLDKINIICQIHGTFSQTLDTHLQGKGCPNCKSSKGERKIKYYLNAYNINYKQEYFFKDLKDKNYLRFDFYLPDYNMCIEFNGKQHYQYSNQFNKTYEQYERSLYRDKLKIEYCQNNNINLLIIKYDENVEDRLSKILL